MGIFASCEGPAGPAGKPGIDGEDGTPGTNGPKGEKGDKGDQGDQGDQGDKGPSGEKGTDGNKGANGEVGTSVYITAELADESELPDGEPENLSDAYLIQGWLWVWSIAEEEWYPLYEIQGVQGPNGERGDQGPPGDSNSGLQVVTVLYDYEQAEISEGSLDNEKLVKDDYARKPGNDAIIKYLIDFPVQGLYATDDVTTLRYSLKWTHEGSEWNFNNPIPSTSSTFTLNAEWTAPPPVNVTSQPGDNIVAKALAYIDENPGPYALLLDTDVTNFAGVTTANINKSNVKLQIIGVKDDGPTTIKMASNGRMFYVGAAASDPSISLSIQNMVLDGNSTNNVIIVQTQQGASLTLTDSKITGNTNSALGAMTGASVTLNNSEISGNNSTTYFVVNVNGGSLVMNGGSITNNTMTNSTSLLGGAVTVFLNGTFTMNGGSITNNTNISTNDFATGGVCVQNGVFRMTSGTISGNKVNVASDSNSLRSAGVMVYGTTPNTTAAFIMTGGRIENNTNVLDGSTAVVPDVYVHHEFTSTNPLVLAGSATIASLMLSSASTTPATGNSRIGLVRTSTNLNWSGVINRLDLRINNASTATGTTSITNNVNYWYTMGNVNNTREIVRGLTGYTGYPDYPSPLPAAVSVSRIALGNFVGTKFDNISAIGTGGQLLKWTITPASPQDTTNGKLSQ